MSYNNYDVLERRIAEAIASELGARLRVQGPEAMPMGAHVTGASITSHHAGAAIPTVPAKTKNGPFNNSIQLAAYADVNLGAEDPASLLVCLRSSLGGSTRPHPCTEDHGLQSPRYAARYEQGSAQMRFQCLVGECGEQLAQLVDDSELPFPADFASMGAPLPGRKTWPSSDLHAPLPAPRGPSGPKKGKQPIRGRVPAPQPPRSSTALADLYDTEADGTLTCRRCNKQGFQGWLGIRSHMSHCPGTKAIKAERQRLLQLYVASGGRAVDFIAQHEQELRQLEAQGRLPVPPSPATKAPASSITADTRLPAQPPRKRRNVRQECDDEQSTAEHHRPSALRDEDRATPLVPTIIKEGRLIVGRHISFLRADTGCWVDATLHGYRERHAAHQLILEDGTVLWTTLTTTNCKLHTGYRGQGPSVGAKASVRTGGEAGIRAASALPGLMGETSGTFSGNDGQMEALQAGLASGGRYARYSNLNAGVLSRSNSNQSSDHASLCAFLCHLRGAGGAVSGAGGANKNAHFEHCDRLLGRSTTAKRKAGQDCGLDTQTPAHTQVTRQTIRCVYIYA